MARTTRLMVAITLGLGLGIGCSPAEEAAEGNPVVLTFKGMVGSTPFSCEKTYPGVAGQTLKPADFRLYVQDVVLLTDAGAELPLSLDSDGKWQSEAVALLDFEDKSGACTGTTEVNTQVRGRVQGSLQGVSGLRFTVGVPFAQNHRDRTVAPPPLNLTSMFWSWQSGYRFVRVEGTTEAGRAYVLHLGSTGCVKDGSGQVTGCDRPNRATVTLSGFAPARSVVVDLAGLVGGADLGGAAECHSQSDGAACGPYYKALGLPVMGSAVAQTVFRVE